MLKLYWRDILVAEQVDDKMHLINREHCPWLLFYERDEVPIFEFINWMKARATPEYQDGIEIFLAELGLEKYDAWEIVKRTNARNGKDWLSVTFE